MPKLSKIVAPALFASLALGAAIPAQAQPYRYDRDRDHAGYAAPGRAQAIGAQIQDLQRRIERNDWRGRISEREARGLRNEVYRLRDQYRVYARNGLSRSEVLTLQDRIDSLRMRLRYERQDRDHRRY